MASTGLNSSVQEADLAAPRRRHRRRADELQRRPHDRCGRRRACSEGLARYFGSSAAAIRARRRRIHRWHARGGARSRAAGRARGGGVRERGGTRRTAVSRLAPAAPRRCGRFSRRHSALSARACAVIDAGLQGVSPEWIERLVGPALTDGFDYVSPYYTRHVNEGTITKGIVYPMFRALYGVRLRQPAAGEFGCSGRLVTHYLRTGLLGRRAGVGRYRLLAGRRRGMRRVPDVRGGARRSRLVARHTGGSEHDAGAGRGRAVRRPGDTAPRSGSASGARSRSRSSEPFRRLVRRRRP